MKFTKVRAGWYETGNETEGAYVITEGDTSKRSWIVSRWTMTTYHDDGQDYLELHNIESAGTLNHAKFLAECDERTR